MNMDGGTPGPSSVSGTKQTGRTTGTELCRRPGTHQVWLLGKPMLKLMRLSPLLHLRHLLLLSLGHCRRVIFNLLCLLQLGRTRSSSRDSCPARQQPYRPVDFPSVKPLIHVKP